MPARAFILVLVVSAAFVRSAEVVRYQLLYGSSISSRTGNIVTSFQASRGSFDLRTDEQTGGSSRYSVENVRINGDLQHQFAGNGTFQAAAGSSIKLSLTLINVAAPLEPALIFTNVAITPDRKWPMLALRVRQDTTNATIYTIDIRAAPFHDIWISSAVDFRASAFPDAANLIRGGDLLSIDGRVIRRNAGLLVQFGPLVVNDYGLDAVSLAAGGGLAISTHDFGTLRDGDILLPTLARRINYKEIFTNAIASSMSDPGIDGLQFTSPTSFYFSVKHNATYAPDSTTTLQLRDADIWWTDVQTHELRLVHSREELFAFAEYQPWLKDAQVGIDAFYIWPSGEVWFSLRSSWTAHTAIYSSDGYGVFTDTFVFQAFKPSIDPGLDAFLVITDLASPPATASSLSVTLSATNVVLQWPQGAGAYQVEAATELSTAFKAISPVTANATFTDVLKQSAAHRFYRIRQW